MSTTILATDPRITYSPSSAWLSNLDDTSTITDTAGATAELSFSGEFVEVFGVISINGERSVSTYSLDNSTSVVFNSTIPTNDEDPPVSSFYQSPRLVDGSHSLLITFIQNQLILTTIVYGSNNLGSKIIPSPSSTTGTPTLPIPSSSSTSSSPTPNSNISSSKLPVGGIVGGISAALVFLVVAALIIFYRLRQRKISSLESQNFDIDYPPTPEPFLLGSHFEARSGSLTGDSREGSTVSVQLPSGLNADSKPSSNSVDWGSIPYSLSTTSTVVVDRSETSFVDEKDGRVLGDSSKTSFDDEKDGRLLGDSSPTPATTTALNYRTTAVSTGSRSTWNTRESAPPPSWSGPSDAPPSYTATD